MPRSHSVLREIWVRDYPTGGADCSNFVPKALVKRPRDEVADCSIPAPAVQTLDCAIQRINRYILNTHKGNQLLYLLDRDFVVSGLSPHLNANP